MANKVGGVISGVDPFIFNESSPITFFLIQASLILVLSNAIHFFVSKLRQPKVISEVISGIILGPTVLGQIPNYTRTMFPKSSVTGLSLVANLGIILFMFFLGMEVDISFVRRNAKAAVSIGLATLIVPFGFGCLFALPLYNAYMDGHGVEFKVFMVFIAVSLSVTAFPVLCRILTELRLVKERVGIIVLTSGTINDVVGWILLALCIILSNTQSKPVNVVYILLCTFGWFLFCCYPIRLTLRWLFTKFHEFERESPSTLSTLLVLIVVLISAYFTDIIGVHPIFGGFIAGVVIPRDNNYVSRLTARMEDIPNLIMIPIYFTIAGLNVDLTLLNKGSDWGYTFASIGIAVSTKVLSGCILSKLNGLRWRESFAVGVLMSCKGIVEIVVLTTGLNAGIITKKVYAMFIFMALISTFITTPLTLWIFPDNYRNELKKQNELPKSELLVNSLKKTEDIKSFHFNVIDMAINNSKAVALSLWFLKGFGSGQQEWRSLYTDFDNDDKHMVKKVVSNDTEAMTVISDETNSSLVINVKHLKLMSERTAEMLETTSMYHNLFSVDNTLEMIRVFSSLFDFRFNGEVLLSSAIEKIGYISKISVSPNDVLLLPLGYPASEHVDSISRILSFNDLTEEFFTLLNQKISSSFLLLFGSTIHYQPNSVVTFITHSTFSSSDLLALYVSLVLALHSKTVKIMVNSTHLPKIYSIQAILPASILNKLEIESFEPSENSQKTIEDAVLTINSDSRTLFVLGQPSISSSCLDDISATLVMQASKNGSTALICHYYENEC